MLQELNRKGAAGKSSLDTVVARKGCSFLGGIAFTCTTSRGCRISSTTGRRRRSEGAELLQQGLHLTLHGCGCGCAVLVIHRLQQLVKTGCGIAKMEVAEDTHQRS